MKNGSLWSNTVFEKEVISHSNNKRLQLKPFIMHLKAHKVMQQGCVFFHYSLATLMRNCTKISPNLLFYVGIQRVRILLFGNYQRFGCWFVFSRTQEKYWVFSAFDLVTLEVKYCIIKHGIREKLNGPHWDLNQRPDTPGRCSTNWAFRHSGILPQVSFKDTGHY